MKLPVGITKLWFKFLESSDFRKLNETDNYFKTIISVFYSGHKY